MSAPAAGKGPPVIELRDVVTETQGYEVLRGASCAFPPWPPSPS